MPYEGFHDRLRLALDRRSPREVGQALGMSPEQVRRIIGGQDPPVHFIAAVCKQYDISADWLLIGRGPMRRSQLLLEGLSQIPAVDLLGSLNVSVRRMLEDGSTAPRADLAPKPPGPPPN